MVAKGARDRRSSSSANTTASTTTNSMKRRVLSATHEKKKVARPIGICGFCLGDDEKGPNGVPEQMISCAECGNSGHPSCLQYPERLVKKIRKIRWQCIDCKRCFVCNKADDSLLFCDFCDAGIHLKCCDPPLSNIPKGDFACHLCRDDETIELTKKHDTPTRKTSLIKTSSSSSTRSRRSNNNESVDDEIPAVISRPVAQLIDGMSNFFLPKKQKLNNVQQQQQRQQSVQKAMKYLRKKSNKETSPTLVKRLSSSSILNKSRGEDDKNQLLAKSILASSKTKRIRRKPLSLNDDTNDTRANQQQISTSTPLLPRRMTNPLSHNKKSLTVDQSITPPARIIRRSGTHPVPDENRKTKSAIKRKHSSTSISPILSTSKKRSRNDSAVQKSTSKNANKKRKESKNDDESANESDDRKPSITKRKVNLDLSKYKNVPAFLNDSLPDTVSENDIHLFLDTRKNASKLISDCSDKFHPTSNESIVDDVNNVRWPPYIVFGADLIQTWYSSSYPQEYARVPRLFICEFCLKYMKCEQVYERHRKNCRAFHPPANEIYHKDDLSVFEVDGNINRIYCQNLCLLAKLFLDHKTLYYDVEPFLFYVLTRNDSNGCHFIGYFSKEKHCPQKYNLSCITILPNSQRRGYGRFLIELSYLLSKKEAQVGTPERPLSTLGAKTYEAYWQLKIVEQLLIYYYEHREKCVLKHIMIETGMAIDDIIETIQNLGILTMKSDEKPVITIDVTQLETIMKNEKIKHANWVSLDDEFLRFTPVLTPLLLTNEEKAIEKQVKQIQVVFKEINRDAAEAAKAADTSNQPDGTEVVRYVRRRKCGQKRKSVYVKRRGLNNNKSMKNETIVTNDDSCTKTSTEPDIINNDDDEHSQEYISRRRSSIINQENTNKDVPLKTDEKEKVAPTTSPRLPPPKQTTFKQLKLDQFLKIVPTQPPPPPAPVEEKSKPNIFVLSPENNESEEPLISDKKNDDDEEILSPTRPATRTTQLQSTTMNTPHMSKSDTDLIKIANGESPSENLRNSDFLRPASITRQISDGALSTTSSNDSSTTTNTLNSSSMSNTDRPLPFKKRAWTSSNLQTSTDTTTPIFKNSPSTENKIEQSIFSRETSVTTTLTSETPSSFQSDIVDHVLMSSSSNGTDEETKIARIESQLKSSASALLDNDPIQDSLVTSVYTAIDAVNDEPPSLTSPTSMIVSQSNHYNYSTRSSVVKQQQQQQQQHQQTITINNFNSSTNMTYNFGNTSYPYSYPPAPSIDMQPFYYPSATAMDYHRPCAPSPMPFYPSPYPASSSSTAYAPYPPGPVYSGTPEQQPMYYPSNGVNPIPYNGAAATPYPYSSTQPSSTATTAAPSTRRC